jgi:metal-sulfur cluster biosynthetic enzyme
MATTREHVLEALARVPEPCSILMKAPTDICAMGLVEDIDIDGGHVGVTLVLTDPSCVHFNAMQRFITDELLGLEGVETVAVGITTRTLWTPDRVRAG